MYETQWITRQFQGTVPEDASVVGEQIPSKFIYGNSPLIEDSPWYHRYFSWISSCQAPVWHYIIQTKSDDPVLRDAAIKKLVFFKGLSDAECSTIASAIDFKTAVALAHAGAKPAMVSRSAVLHPEKKKMCLASKFREILNALPPESIHEVMLSTCFAALKTYRPTEDEKLDKQLDSASGFHTEFDTLRPLRYISEESFLIPCLQALLSHSRILEQVPTMLKHGAMDLLLVISAKYKSDYDITALVVKILSSIACSPCSDVAFEEAGILGWLAELAGSSDVRLSFPARKVLHNLDRENSKYILPPGIYQVYPDTRTNEDHIKMDIIFVHGIMGGAFRTWRSQDLNAVWRFTKPKTSSKEGLCDRHSSSTVDSIRRRILNPDQSTPKVDVENSSSPSSTLSIFRERLKDLKSISNKLLSLHEDNQKARNREIRDGKMFYFPVHEEMPVELEILPVTTQTKCWPRDWLPLDLENIRVICTDFETFVSHWNPVMPIETSGRTIAERSDELIEKLMRSGIGSRPIVWVCHSAGGIIVKQVLHLAEMSHKEELQMVAKNTTGVIFCSTPHFGSFIIGLGKTGKSIWLPTIEIMELTKGSNELRRIDEAFHCLYKKYSYEVVSFGELCPTLASVGISKNLVTEDSSDPGYGEYFGLRVDHLNICKPKSRKSFIYVKILDTIRRIIDKKSAN